MKLKEMKKPVLDIVSNKKYQWIATIAILVVILFMSINIRVSNWDLLTDSTTGEKIPLALDPYYFLRVAETIVENDGVLPEFDGMRYNPITGTPWHPEIMPRVIVGMWRGVSVFDSDVSLRAVDVASPVVFYGIGLILFFLFVYVLTGKKALALLASIFLAFNPGYLYRTMAGFSDHESIGMVAFFLALLVYSLGMIYIEKRKSKLWHALLFGVALALTTVLSLASWSGVTNFLFMIIPLSFFLFWIFKVKEREHRKVFALKGVLFYAGWIVFSMLFGPLFGREMGFVFRTFQGSSNILSLAILGFIVVDLIFIIKRPNFIKNKFRLLYSMVVAGIVGLVGLFAIGENPLALILKIFAYLIRPFADSRFGSTVAENAQPFLQDWINNVGVYSFWLFIFGSVLFGVYLSKKISNRKRSLLFGASYIFMMVGIVFSKYSSSSILNGSNFISQAFYLVALLTFLIYFFYVYLNEKFDWDSRDAIIFALVFFVMVAGRAAARVFFVITPFVCFMAAYFVVQLYYYWKDSREEITKMVFVILFVIGIIMAGVSINSSMAASSYSARGTGPSANTQWQGAMSWVRGNTNEDAVFSHWWDYGYWVQTLGERATISDGGHFQGAEDGNHKIGRYVLTTPNPETAYSYFKSMNISHLLIDQTDLGKYPAYSKIGGGDGVNELDRYAAIPIMVADAKQTRETTNGTTIIFGGGAYIFEDIIYEDVFLPAGKAAIIGIVINLNGNSMGQPEGVYVYNNIQTRIPLRYVYVNDKIVDFGDGLDVIVDIIPAFDGGSINQMGAAIYLSQKVSKSLFAQLFLMDDPFNNYETIELVHTEDNPVVASLKSQGVPFGDFIYYQGFRGPIKIWNTENIPEEIKIVPEFYDKINFDEVGFGSLDRLFG